MNKNIRIFIRHSDVAPDGRILRVHPWKKSNTLTKQFLQMFLLQLSADNQTIHDLAEVDRVISPQAGSLKVQSATTETWGVIIGTGTTAVVRTDYKLETQVSTNIAHATASFELLNPTGDDWHLLIHRGFTNNTAGSIAVTEVGLVCTMGSTPYYGLIDRTLYSFTFAAGTTKTVTYKIQI